MPQILTDADIARLSPQAPLSDADIAAHDSGDTRNLFQKIRDFPGEGANRAIAGVKEFFHEPSFHAAHEVLAGGAQALTPFAIPALAAAPVATVVGALGAGVGGAAGKAGATLAGANEDVANVVGDVASLAGGAATARGASAATDLASRLWHTPEARDLAIQAIPGGSRVTKVVRAIQAVRANGQASDITDTMEDLAKEWFNNSFQKLPADQQTKVRALAGRLDKPLPPELSKPPAGYQKAPPPRDPDTVFRDQYARAVQTEPGAEPTGGTLAEGAPPEPFNDAAFREQYSRAVRPEDETFREQYGRAVQFGPDSFEPGGMLTDAGPQRPGGPLRAPLTQPNPAPPAIPKPNAGGAGPLRAPLKARLDQALASMKTETPAPAAQPETALKPGSQAEQIARQLFEEAKASGTVAKTAKPGAPDIEPGDNSQSFADQARARRATSAQTLADTFHQFGISSVETGKVPLATWQELAKAKGIDWPATDAAKVKLIRDVTKNLMQRERGQ